MQVPAAALDAEVMAALHGTMSSGVVTGDGGSLPATMAEEDAMRPTTHMDLDPCALAHSAS